jgi:hypothetical protein
MMMSPPRTAPLLRLSRFISESKEKANTEHTEAQSTRRKFHAFWRFLCDLYVLCDTPLAAEAASPVASFNRTAPG